MREITLDERSLHVVGALDLDRSPTGVTPRRLPAWTRPQLPDIVMDVIVQMPSGVRLRFASDTTTVELDAMLTLLQMLPRDLVPATFDLVIDGELAAQRSTSEGNVIGVVAADPAAMTFDLGEPVTIRFDDLPPGEKVIELWLPQASTMELRGLRIDDAATIAPSPPRGRRWVHHGSSISHCLEASSPSRTWPAVAASLAQVELTSLGFGGQCMLDPFVARTIRDLPADVISLKIGINLVNGDTMRDRTFGPALHGFIDTIREGHPDTPLLLVSPIFCPSAETRPGPTIPGPDGRFVTVDGLDDLRLTCLTLTKIREAMASIVRARTDLGDVHLFYLDGLELFGAADAGDLHDDLHPNAEGYVRMGERFAALAFGPDAPLG